MTVDLAPPLATTHQPRFWVRRFELIVVLLVCLGPPIVAWVYYLSFGLPDTLANEDPANPQGTHQFPIWIRIWHYLNLLLVVLLSWTGWQILADQPRLAWSASGGHWLEFDLRRQAVSGTSPSTRDRLPFWHAIMAVGWAATGAVYLTLVSLTGERQHILPQSWVVFPEAFHVFVHYSTFHLPLDPDGFYRYNSLQLLSYAIVMLGLVPMIALTGLAISPAVNGPFRGLVRLFGNRETARSVHYLMILGYFAFIAIHLFFVIMYAIWLNGNHIVLGTDESGLPGWLIGGVGIGLIAGIVWFIRRIVWRFPQSPGSL